MFAARYCYRVYKRYCCHAVRVNMTISSPLKSLIQSMAWIPPDKPASSLLLPHQQEIISWSSRNSVFIPSKISSSVDQHQLFSLPSNFSIIFASSPDYIIASVQCLRHGFRVAITPLATSAILTFKLREMTSSFLVVIALTEGTVLNCG